MHFLYPSYVTMFSKAGIPKIHKQPNKIKTHTSHHYYHHKYANMNQINVNIFATIWKLSIAGDTHKLNVVFFVIDWAIRGRIRIPNFFYEISHELTGQVLFMK